MTTRFAILISIAAAATLSGCAGFHPRPLGETSLLQRTETQTEREFSVTVAVPTTEEVRHLFDAKLHKKLIQPIWLEIENHGEKAILFFPHSVDPDYFSALEVAWQAHRTWANKTNLRIDAYFYDQAIPFHVPAGAAVSGFVFVNLDMGTKYVPVKLLREGEERTFEFFIEVPGFPADHTAVDFEALYEGEEIIDLVDEEAVKRWAEGLPCCTMNAKGTRAGDPINFVLVGSDDSMVSGFLRSGWNETVLLTSGSAMRTGSSAVFGKEDRYAPISPLYVRGRPQDIGLQKARRRVHQRNHLRLWLAPVTYRGKPVWIGQISRDIGSRMTTQSSTLTTHKIDPDVDDARDVIVLDLIRAGVLAAVGYASGVEEASPDAPRQNLTGDPYFTDGLRAVLFLGDGRTPLEEVRVLGWEEP